MRFLIFALLFCACAASRNTAPDQTAGISLTTDGADHITILQTEPERNLKAKLLIDFLPMTLDEAITLHENIYRISSPLNTIANMPSVKNFSLYFEFDLEDSTQAILFFDSPIPSKGLGRETVIW